ncbi:hypothetical protein GCM10010187_73250 [Actinomadura coerulea]|nr:hypothetical protein GCM10010187_73250 [Actinomadura coerulea]
MDAGTVDVTTVTELGRQFRLRADVIGGLGRPDGNGRGTVLLRIVSD